MFAQHPGNQAGGEGGVDGERQGGGGEKHTAAKSSCVSPPATSNGAGNINTRLTSIPAAPRLFGAQCQQVIKSVQPPTEKKCIERGEIIESALSLRAGRGKGSVCKKKKKKLPLRCKLKQPIRRELIEAF